MSDTAASRIRAELERALAAGRIHGAYLFHGPEGTGKRAAALWLASRLLGVAEPPAGGSLAHPDLHLIEPDDYLRIEQVRELQRRLSLVANEGGHRVGLLFGLENTRNETAHALLKTLEEPPAATTLILITSAPAALPLTIRSRTTEYRFAPAPAQWLESQLREEGIAEDDAWLAASLGGGSLEAARGWADEHLDEARELLDTLRSAPGGTASAALDAAESFRGGAAARARAALFLDVHGVLARREIERAAGEGETERLDRWLTRAETGLRARREMAVRNLNPQLVCESLLLDLVP